MRSTQANREMFALAERTWNGAGARLAVVPIGVDKLFNITDTSDARVRLRAPIVLFLKFLLWGLYTYSSTHNPIPKEVVRATSNNPNG